MGQFDGELAALKHQRTVDAFNSSPILDNLVDATITVAENVAFPFTGLIRRALALGKIPVEKMIDNLESAVYEENKRIWEYLRGKENQQEEFAVRLQSQEAQGAFLSAVFHGLRTSDPEKQSRLGVLTINCVYVDDLKPESLDGMMRAVVELTEHDIRVLKSIYEMQIYFFTTAEMSKPYNSRAYDIRSKWERWWEHDAAAYLRDGGAAFRSSTVRLQSAGLIASIGSQVVLHGPAIYDYELLIEGKKLCERLQEIGVTE